MNKEQIIDEVYKKYQTEMMFHPEDNWLEELDGMNMSNGERKKVYRQYAPVEFINKCKTNPEFSERWELQIEERELSEDERYNWYIQTHKKNLSRSGNQYSMGDILNSNNCPTKLITIKYNNETIESYE